VDAFSASIARKVLRTSRTCGVITCDIINAGTIPVTDLTNSAAMSSKLVWQRIRGASGALDAAEGKDRRIRAGKKR